MTWQLWNVGWNPLMQPWRWLQGWIYNPLKHYFVCGWIIKNKTNNCTKNLFKNIYCTSVFHVAFQSGNRCSYCLRCLSTLVRCIFEILMLIDIVLTPEGERHSVISQPFWWQFIPSWPWASTFLFQEVSAGAKPNQSGSNDVNNEQFLTHGLPILHLLNSTFLYIVAQIHI